MAEEKKGVNGCARRAAASGAHPNQPMHPTANSGAFIHELGCLFSCARGG